MDDPSPGDGTGEKTKRKKRLVGNGQTIGRRHFANSREQGTSLSRHAAERRPGLSYQGRQALHMYPPQGINSWCFRTGQCSCNRSDRGAQSGSHLAVVAPGETWLWLASHAGRKARKTQADRDRRDGKVKKEKKTAPD